MYIRKMHITEAPDIAHVHMVALPDDVLPSLGISTLISYYKQAFDAKYPNNMVLLGAFEGNVLVGFCQVAFESFSLKKIIKLDAVIRIVLLGLFRPGVFWNGVVQSLNPITLDEETAELAFIAVLPEKQMAGIGKLLIKEAMDQSAKRKKHWLITKTANNNLSRYYKDNLHANTVTVISSFRSKYEVLKWPIKFADCKIAA